MGTPMDDANNVMLAATANRMMLSGKPFDAEVGEILCWTAKTHAIQIGRCSYGHGMEDDEWYCDEFAGAVRMALAWLLQQVGHQENNDPRAGGADADRDAGADADDPKLLEL